MTVVTAYIQNLRQELPGPRRARSELLAELRDGLNDAADAYQARGLTRAEAEHEAVAEAGEPSEIAREYREVLANAQGRRTATLFAVSQLLSIVMWDRIWDTPGPWDAGYAAAQPTAAMVCWRIIDWAGGIGGASAIVCLVLLVIGARRGWSSRPTIVGQAVIGATSVAVVMACSVLGNMVNGAHAVAILSAAPLLTGIGILSGTVAILQLGWCWRSIRLAQFA